MYHHAKYYEDFRNVRGPLPRTSASKVCGKNKVDPYGLRDHRDANLPPYCTDAHLFTLDVLGLWRNSR